MDSVNGIILEFVVTDTFGNVTTRVSIDEADAEPRFSLVVESDPDWWTVKVAVPGDVFKLFVDFFIWFELDERLWEDDGAWLFVCRLWLSMCFDDDVDFLCLSSRVVEFERDSLFF